MQSKHRHYPRSHSKRKKCTIISSIYYDQQQLQHCNIIATMCSTRSKPSHRRTRTRTRKPKFASLRDRLAPVKPTRTRKPKFASLRNRLAPVKPQAPPSMVDEHFPLQPDSDTQVVCLLEPNSAVGASATISELFGPSSSSSAAFDEARSPVSTPSMEWDGEGLARRALRGRERWVFCRSSSLATDEAVSSGCVSAPSQGLFLKLDYEEILKAWSDKGSLYIDGEGPQIVPELQQQIFADDWAAPSMFIEVGSNGGSLRVPEMEGDKEDEEQRMKVEKRSSRKERVMRYKEKRQSRLFSKRIRYEVRKLNAEKRPRVKGRFVKRNDDM